MVDRKLNRWHRFDYSSSGYYFVTICTKDRKPYFAKIKNGDVLLNAHGKFAETCWKEIPLHFSNACIDEFIIMPNHIHGIIILKNTVGDAHGHPHIEGNADRRSLHLRSQMYLPKIMNAYKSSVTRTIKHTLKDNNFSWQKSYHDHIIRNDYALVEIRQYIRMNPLKWDIDAENI